MSIARFAATCAAVFLMHGVAQAEEPYRIKYLYYPEGTPGVTYLTSTHFRIVWGTTTNIAISYGDGIWCSNEARAYLDILEKGWTNAVIGLGFNAPHEAADPALRDGNKYFANFYCTRTKLQYHQEGAVMGSKDSFGWAMADVIDLKTDPDPGMVGIHEWYHACEMHTGEHGGFNNKGYMGAMWETVDDYMLEQYFYNTNLYPKGPSTGWGGTAQFQTLNNLHLFHPHGRNHYSAWMIWNFLSENNDNVPEMGTNFAAKIWRETLSEEPHYFPTMERITGLTVEDILINYAKRIPTTDFKMQDLYWKVLVRDQFFDMGVARMTPELLRVPDRPNWWRVPLEMAPMAGSQNNVQLIPSGSGAGRVVTVNFRGLSNSVMNASWRACLTAVDTNGGWHETYGTPWASGANSITLGAADDCVYLSVVAMAHPFWPTTFDETSQMFARHPARVQYPWEVEITGATPKETPLHEKYALDGPGHRHPNGGGFVENSATVASTAYVGTNAVVAEYAQVLGTARIEDYALVRGHAVVKDNAIVSGHARILDYAVISDRAKVCDYGYVLGNTVVADHAKVLEHGMVYDKVIVSNNAIIKGSSEVHSGWAYEEQRIVGTAIVEGDWSSPNSAMHGVHCGAAYWPGPYSISSNFIESLRDIGTLTVDYEFNRQHDSLAEDNWGLMHGYVEGSPAWMRTDGVRSGFLALNGSNQYLTLRNSVCDAEDITLMLWVKWDGGAADQQLFYHGSGASKYLYLTPASSVYATGLVFAINNGIGENVLKTSTLSSGVWKHIAITLSNDTGRLYVDGTLADTVTNIAADPEDLSESNRNNSSNAVFVGRGPAGNYLAGAIDGVRVYRSALSAAEIGDIKQHYYPCVRYGFNETNGTVVADTYGAYNATVSDSGGWTNVAGRGRVLYLNGTSRFVSLPDTIADQRNLTVACWVKFQSGSTIFDFGNSASWYMALKPNTAGKLNWNTYGGLGYACIYDAQNVYGNASTAVDNDRWVHVAYTIDGNNNVVKLYRDGVCVGTNMSANAWESLLLPRPDDFAPTNCYVGRSQSGAYSRMFIDDLMIYGRALTADEVASVMTSTAESPLVINTGISNATLGAVDACGAVLSTGTAPASVSVYWGKTDGGDVIASWSSNRLVTSAATVGSVTSRLQGLEAGKTYYFRFYAINAVGSNWATPSFTFVAPQGCEVNNEPGATNVVFASAALNGMLTASYTTTNHVFIYWGASNGGTNRTAWATQTYMGNRSVGGFSTNLAGLLSGTKYYYRAFASNVYGGWWANATTTFTTRIAALVDNDGGASNITAVSATLRGTLGGVPGTTASYEAENAVLYQCQVLTDSFASGGAKVGSFTYYADYILFTNVPSTTGVTIHYAAPASRQCSLYVGTGDVATVYFPATPGWSDYSVVTLNVPVNGDVKLQIDGDDRDANGYNETGIDVDRITTGVAATPVYVFWGINDGGPVKSAWSNVVSIGSVSPGAFSAAISNLGPATVHYYRCYASNALGETWAAVSTNFITLAPIIVNNAGGESGVATNAVTLNGNLAYSMVSQAYVFVYWGIADGGTNKGAWANTIALGPLATGLFSSTVTSLAADQAFYYRCYASNAVTTAWAASSEPFSTAKDFGGWSNMLKISFANYDRPTALTNFPALVVLNEAISYFRYNQFAAPNGGDLRFADKNNVELRYEIDEWNPGSSSFVWVQVPLLTCTDTYIYAYWGNSVATSFPVFTTNGAAWSENFAAVWHMTETNALDSLSLNNGTSQGATNAPGLIGIGQGMPGGADRSVLVGTVKTNLDIRGPLSVSAWVYFNSTAAAGILTKGTTWGDYNLQAKGGAGNYLSLETKPFCNDSSSSPVGTTPMLTGQWHYVCGTWDGSMAKVYVNGMEDASKTTNGIINNSTHQLKIGTLNDRYLCGSLDEVSVANVSRSADWIWACYMNQGNNAGFNRYQMLAYPPSASINNGGGASGITVNSAVLNGALVSTASSPTQVSMFWGSTDGGTDSEAWVNRIDFGARGLGAFATNIARLSDRMVYYYRCQASNAAGLAWAATSACFTTLTATADLTFYSFGDSHYGSPTGETGWVYRINEMLGYTYPPALGGGTVGVARGVLALGDLINDGGNYDAGTNQWAMWKKDYGVNGEGTCKYPMFENFGNHDLSSTRFVQKDIIARNLLRTGLTAVSSNGLHYSWDWNGIHFVALNIYPADTWIPENTFGSIHDPEYALAFLKWDLEQNVGDSGRPVVTMHHYDFLTAWWPDRQKLEYPRWLDGYNVVLILHGHQGAPYGYDFQGYTVSGQNGSLNVAHFTTNNQIQLAQSTSNNTWGSTYTKSFSFPDLGNAWSPMPKNGYWNLSTNAVQLGWHVGAYVVSQAMYFGTSSNAVASSIMPALSGLGAGITNCGIPAAYLPLQPGTQYFWRVDQYNCGRPVSKGKIWTFRTRDAVKPNDLTFYVMSDIHYQLETMIANKRRAQAMNRVPGTVYPPAIGGTVESARGVLFGGDAASEALQWQYDMYTNDHGFSGTEGLLEYPVAGECNGNHDGGLDSIPGKALVARNRARTGITNISTNGLFISWDWDGVHFVTLGVRPGANTNPYNSNGSLQFLIDDLATNVGNSGRPVVLIQHFGLDDYAKSWWTEEERTNYYRVVQDYNIIGIFHGHTHSCTIYPWQGLDVFNCLHMEFGGSVAVTVSSSEGFFVGRIQSNTFSVAERKADGTWGLNLTKSFYRSYAEDNVPAVINNGTGPSNIAATSALLAGKLVYEGASPTYVYVYYGLSSGVTNKSAWSKVAELGLTSTGAFAVAVSNLAPLTAYNYRCYASNALGSAWASIDASFITLPPAEVNNANGATDVRMSAASLNGNLIATNAPTYVYICWGPTDGGTNKAAWTNEIPLGLRQLGAFSNTISSLAAETMYFYRCCASNSLGIRFASSTASFRSQPPVSVDNALGATDMTEASATLNGTLLITNAAPTYVLIYWGTNDGGTVKGNWSHEVALGTQVPGAFSSSITGLTAEMRYYYRCFGTNSAGGRWAVSSSAFETARDFTPWANKMKITLRGYTRGEPLMNFPVLVALHGGITNFSYNQFASPDGGDLRFGNENNSELKFEIDEWNPGGTSYVWVQLPVLASSNTYIWAYWGNPAVTNFPVYSTNGAVWSEGFAAVWHMSETNALDSLNLNHGKSQGATNATGLIGISQGMPGGADRSVLVSTVKPNLDITGSISVIAWVYYNGTDMAGLLTKGAVWGNYNLQSKGGAANYASFETKPFCTDAASAPVGTTSMVSGKWYYVAGTWNGSQAKVFVNGREESSKTTNGIIDSASHVLKLGTLNDRYLCGSLDEVSVASVSRSSNWIWACYMNQGSNTAFCNYQMIAYNPAVAAINNGNGASAITLNAAVLNGELAATAAAPTYVSLFWGATDGGTTSQAWTNRLNMGARGLGAFSTNIAGLAAGMTYFYRCYASNAAGFAWADASASFTTLSGGPIISNSVAGNIMPVSADLNGYLSSTGAAPAYVWLFWGTTDSGTNKGTWTGQVAMGLRNPGGLTINLSSLARETTYYYRYYASNTYGAAWGSPSISFVTPSGKPSITNTAASSIATSSATLNGAVLSTGLAPAYIWVFWGTANGGTVKVNWANSEALGICGVGAVSRNRAGLSSGTTYYYAYYASNTYDEGWATPVRPFTTLGSGNPFVNITNADATVGLVVSNYTFGGTNNAFTTGSITWTNTLGGSGSLPASSTGWAFSVVLAIGANTVVARGSNDADIVHADTVTVTRLPNNPMTYYWDFGAGNAGLTNWNNAVNWYNATLGVNDSGFPNGAGDIAWQRSSDPYIGNAPGFRLNQDITVGQLVFEKSLGDNCTIGTGSVPCKIIFDNNGSEASLIYYKNAAPQSGQLTIIVRPEVELRDDLSVYVWSARTGNALLGTIRDAMGETNQMRIRARAEGANMGWVSLSASNAYRGGTVVMSAGGTISRVIGNAHSSFGRGDVTVRTNAILQLNNFNNIDNAASLYLECTNGNYAMVWLVSGINETVNKLFSNNVQLAAGTYGPSGSSATFKNDNFFTNIANAGILTVLSGPPSASPADVQNFGIGRGAQYGHVSLSWSNATITVLACTNRLYTSQLSYWFTLTNGVTSPWVHVAATNFPSVYYRIVSGPYTSAYDVGKFDVDIAAGSIAWLSFPFAPLPGCDTLGEWFGRQLEARDYSSYAYPMLQMQNGSGGSIISRSYYIDSFGDGTTNWFSSDDQIMQNAGYVLFLAQDHPAVKLTCLGMVPTNGVVLQVAYQTIPWIGLSYPSGVDMRNSGITNLFTPPQKYSMFDYDSADSQQVLGGPVWYAEYFIDDWGTGSTNFFTAVAGADQIEPGKGYLLFFSTTRTQSGTWHYARPY